jgi:hypothetical protein
VLDLDGDTHDGGHGELHHSDAVGIFFFSDGSSLDEVGIDTDETDGVTAGNIGNRFDLTSHHNDGSLDVLDVEIGLGSGLVVGAHDSNFLSSCDGSTENTTESVEAAIVIGGDHFGDVDHKGAELIAVLDGLA